jgi:hypothetical protein
MPATIIGNPAVVTGLYQAFNGKAAGYNTYVNNLAYAAQNGPAAYAAEIGKGFYNVPAATLAASVLTNVGIVNATLQDALEQIFTAYPVQARGQIVLNLVNLLTNLEGDATYGAAATAWNQLVGSNNAYSNNPTNVSDAIVDANTVTLTASTDQLTANNFIANLVYTPGGDNRINSLQDEDQLTGTGTDAKLTATLGNSNDNGATVITPSLTNIATIDAAFTGSGGTAVTGLDLQDASGLSVVNLTRVSQAINSAEVGNIQSALTKMSLSNTNSNQAGTVEFSFNGGALAGANTGTMALSNVNVLNLNIGQNTSLIGARGVSNQGYETLTLESNGSANAIGTLNLPMDTGSAGALVITGSQDLRLGARANVVNAVNGALVEAAGLYTAGTGVAQAGGRIASIDASALTGNLSIVLDNILDVGKADTSGVLQNVTVTGGSGDDTFALFDAIQAGDSLNGGDGTDTLIINGTNNVVVGANGSIASVAQSIETVSMLSDGIAMAADFDFLPDVTGVVVRNVGNALGVNFADAAVSFSLTDLTVAQAAGITVQHSTTGNNQIANTTIEAAIKANTAADTLGVTIDEGTNVDPRFNFTIDTVVANTATATTAAVSTFENITLTDSDTESNSVELQNFAQHTGTITLTGGQAGTFLNLDVDTAGADVTANITGADGLAAGVQQGLYGINTDGTAVDLRTGSVVDVGNLATQVRLGAATINAAGEASNVIVRVSTNVASAVGAQAITMGTGNDTVIFDFLGDARAGLTISDTVVGGDGNDTLVIDGNGTNVNLGASEWTNVSGFETLRTVGLGGVFTYNLTLTNDLIDANGTDMLAIVNDNDSFNDTALNADTGTIAANAESAVTIDARSLSSINSFSYNGEEGASRTADRFIFSDANVNGRAIIDGGAVDNSAVTNSAANGDVLEVRNSAVVTAGDLNGVSNVGTIAFNNDQAVAQVLTLQLNDAVIDAMVDSYHVSSVTQRETLNVDLTDAGIAEVAGVGLLLDVVGLTGKSGLNVTLATGAGAAVDTLALSASGGVVTVANFVSATDKVQLSKAAFAGLVSAAGGALGAAELEVGAGLTAAATAAGRLVFDTTGKGLYYDADGTGGNAAVQIATLTGVAAVVAADFAVVA